MTVWSGSAGAPVPSMTRTCVSATVGASTPTNSRVSCDSCGVCVAARGGGECGVHAAAKADRHAARAGSLGIGPSPECLNELPGGGSGVYHTGALVLPL